MLTPDQIQRQSQRAYRQWATQWREHARIHAQHFPVMKSLNELEYSGIGKAVLCVANGYSLEQEIGTIQKYQDNVDIICCDKSLGNLLEHGIKPKYCLVADANVSFEKYLEKWKDQVADTILISNVCSNPEWSLKAKWKDHYFFCVMDCLKSEKEFQALSGCPNVVAAGTNVSNSLVIFLTQCDNGGRKNFFAYDKILLIGFDFCWKLNGNYYAFDREGSGKHNYMRHVYLMNLDRELCMSSGNLVFSAKWLDQYVNAFKLPVIQCTRQSIFATKFMGTLAQQMQYRGKIENRKTVVELFNLRKLLIEKKKQAEETLAEIARDHYYSFLASV